MVFFSFRHRALFGPTAAQRRPNLCPTMIRRREWPARAAVRGGLANGRARAGQITAYAPGFDELRQA